MGNRIQKFKSHYSFALGIGMLVTSVFYSMGSVLIDDYWNPLVVEHNRLERRLNRPVKIKELLNPSIRDSFVTEAAYYSREILSLESSLGYPDQQRRFNSEKKRRLVVFPILCFGGLGFVLYSSLKGKEDEHMQIKEQERGENDTLQ